ncbi:MAG: hypothetical protein ACOYMF_05515 [Bacteroidales bacterium]
MQYSQEQLEKIKEYASELMRPDHIALLLGIDQDEFKRKIQHRGSEAYLAYGTGRAETILVLRRQELKLAKLGSPMAVEMVHKFLIDQGKT